HVVFEPETAESGAVCFRKEKVESGGGVGGLDEVNLLEIALGIQGEGILRYVQGAMDERKEGTGGLDEIVVSDEVVAVDAGACDAEEVGVEKAAQKEDGR